MVRNVPFEARLRRPGIKNPPERVVTSSTSASTPNRSTYLAPQIFLVGLALTTRSSLAVLLFVATSSGFNARAAKDEQPLRAPSSEPYERYRGARAAVAG